MSPPRFARGPQANARQEDLDDLASAGRGDTVPSVVGFNSVKKDGQFGQGGSAVKDVASQQQQRWKLICLLGLCVMLERHDMSQ